MQENPSNENFADFGLPKPFLSVLAGMGIEAPVEVQSRSYKPISNGQDVILVSPTGSGKTLAYLLPVLAALRFNQPGGARALILAPTRELAMQVHRVAGLFQEETTIKPVLVMGGGNSSAVMKELEKEDYDLIVATPKGLFDFYLNSRVNFKKVKHLIIDEFEKLFDPNFTKQFYSFLEVLPKKRQNILASATFNDRSQRIVDEFLEWPTVIQSKKAIEAATPDSIRLYLYKAGYYNQKKAITAQRIRQADKKTIVFVNTKKLADRLKEDLQKIGIRADLVHSNKDQNTRTASLQNFYENNTKVLITTDLMSRGFDDPGVGQVIHLNLPLSVQDFIHRSGRTGRMDSQGDVVLLLDTFEKVLFDKYPRDLRNRVLEEPIPAEAQGLKADPGELQEVARKLDFYRQKLDPTYKGAFHRKDKKK